MTHIPGVLWLPLSQFPSHLRHEVGTLHHAWWRMWLQNVGFGHEYKNSPHFSDVVNTPDRFTSFPLKLVFLEPEVIVGKVRRIPFWSFTTLLAVWSPGMMWDCPNRSSHLPWLTWLSSRSDIGEFFRVLPVWPPKFANYQGKFHSPVPWTHSLQAGFHFLQD